MFTKPLTDVGEGETPVRFSARFRTEMLYMRARALLHASPIARVERERERAVGAVREWVGEKCVCVCVSE
jgi:hypothetical protein